MISLLIEPFNPGDRVTATDSTGKTWVGNVIECRREPQEEGKPDEWNVWFALGDACNTKVCARADEVSLVDPNAF
jgi:hypothetical protein